MLDLSFQNFELILWKKWIRLADTVNARRKTRGVMKTNRLTNMIVGVSGGSIGLIAGISIARQLLLNK